MLLQEKKGNDVSPRAEPKLVEDATPALQEEEGVKTHYADKKRKRKAVDSGEILLPFPLFLFHPMIVSAFGFYSTSHDFGLFMGFHWDWYVDPVEGFSVFKSSKSQKANEGDQQAENAIMLEKKEYYRQLEVLFYLFIVVHDLSLYFYFIMFFKDTEWREGRKFWNLTQ